MVQHTNGNTRWATKQKYECVIRTHGTTITHERLNKSILLFSRNIQMEIQDERLNKSMNVL